MPRVGGPGAPVPADGSRGAVGDVMLSPTCCAAVGPMDPAEADYLIFDHAKIYASHSRHWMVVWLWFLS
jgi:hypothetical protein